MKWIKQQLNFQSRSEAVWKFQLLVINLDFHNDLHCPIWTESREQIYRQWILIQLLQLNINSVSAYLEMHKSKSIISTSFGRYLTDDSNKCRFRSF